MTGIVVDASVALAWGIPDEASDYADAVLLALEDHTLIAPAIWPIELSNALIVAERRERLKPDHIERFVTLLETLPTRLDFQGVAHTAHAVLPLARAHQLSAYDATYLELALRERAPLATLDTTTCCAANSCSQPSTDRPRTVACAFSASACSSESSIVTFMRYVPQTTLF